MSGGHSEGLGYLLSGSHLWTHVIGQLIEFRLRQRLDVRQKILRVRVWGGEHTSEDSEGEGGVVAMYDTRLVITVTIQAGYRG